jgi:hypothetical protein
MGIFVSDDIMVPVTRPQARILIQNSVNYENGRITCRACHREYEVELGTQKLVARCLSSCMFDRIRSVLGEDPR